MYAWINPHQWRAQKGGQGCPAPPLLLIIRREISHSPASYIYNRTPFEGIEKPAPPPLSMCCTRHWSTTLPIPAPGCGQVQIGNVTFIWTWEIFNMVLSAALSLPKAWVYGTWLPIDNAAPGAAPLLDPSLPKPRAYGTATPGFRHLSCQTPGLSARTGLRR